MKTVLETERLRLREVHPGDLDFVAEMTSDPKVMRYYPRLFTYDEARQWIEIQLERYAEDGHGFWMVEDLTTGRPLGQVGLAMQEVDGTRQPEIGYRIHHPYWRRGYASEAALGVRRYAFQDLDLPRVISLIRPINRPSQAVAAKMDMKPEGKTIFHGLEHLIFAVRRADLE